MSSTTTLAKVAGAGSLAGAAGLAVVAAATPALAATECPVGSTDIGSGVCEVKLTASGSYTAPAGVTTLEAILIGGGGAGQFTYDNFEYDAGSAGDITYVSGLDTNGPIAVTIGQGGVSSADAEIDSSGNGSATTLDDGSSSSSAPGGIYRAGTMTAGLLPSSVVASATGNIALWPAYSGEVCYAADGQDDLIVPPGTLPTVYNACGEGLQSDGALNSARANSGSGGASTVYDDDFIDGGDGGSGIVIFHFPMSQVAVAAGGGSAGGGGLAETGSDSLALTALSAGLAAAGIALIGFARQRRKV